MNSKLVDSIIEMIHSLPEDEQQTVVAKLNQTIPSPPVSANNPPILSENIDDSANNPPILSENTDTTEDAWEVFATLGDDAIPGKLDNPSIHHDRYLYKKY
ncbi:hypothetical protein E1H12_12820 [Geitlerinema sp. P-1104]|uniref:hypothetical protein n=1 Tax=Geitlerinema sp. P-1104 TaxID=2546230 RepID=UPI001476F5D2|nr:hypothetical protein [Geitlerinema sp. P-1104]NMG59374.1 hypothetical protein [Geitlerinema sp. P-1104]